MYIIIAVNSGKKDGMSVFTGAGVAIITPMKANGEVNYDKLGEFLDYQINNSTDAIIISWNNRRGINTLHMRSM